jgi:hypothetical protein
LLPEQIDPSFRAPGKVCVSLWRCALMAKGDFVPLEEWICAKQSAA